MYLIIKYVLYGITNLIVFQTLNVCIIVYCSYYFYFTAQEENLFYTVECLYRMGEHASTSSLEDIG